MRTLRTALILVLQLAYASVGCGGSTGDDSSQDAGHTGAGGTGAGGTGTGGASTSCDVVGTAAALIQVCADAASCVKEQCTTQLSACLGSSYVSGIYSGMPCSDYGNCVKSCNCVSSCSSSCPVSAQCNTCLTGTILGCVVQQCSVPYFNCMSNSN